MILIYWQGCAAILLSAFQTARVSSHVCCASLPYAKKVVAWDKSPRASAGRVRRRALAYKKAAADTDPFHLSLPSILPHYGQNVNSAVSKAGMNPLYPKASSYSWRTIKNPDYRNRWKWKNSWLNVTSSYWCLQNYQQSVFTYKAREHLDFMCHLISLASEWTIFIYIYI